VVQVATLALVALVATLELVLQAVMVATAAVVVTFELDALTHGAT
jgi:hypothetical protein